MPPASAACGMGGDVVEPSSSWETGAGPDGHARTGRRHFDSLRRNQRFRTAVGDDVLIEQRLCDLAHFAGKSRICENLLAAPASAVRPLADDDVPVAHLVGLRV